MRALKEVIDDPGAQDDGNQDVAKPTPKASFLKRWIGPCFPKSRSEIGSNTTERLGGVDKNQNSTLEVKQVEPKSESVRNDGEGNKSALPAKFDINPLKKYAPVSVPGWEVNIIYKPGPLRKRHNTEKAEVQDSVQNSDDVATLTVNMESQKEILVNLDVKDVKEPIEIRETVEKSGLWNPVTAVQKLMNRFRGGGAGRGGESGFSELNVIRLLEFVYVLLHVIMLTMLAKSV